MKNFCSKQMFKDYSNVVCVWFIAKQLSEDSHVTIDLITPFQAIKLEKAKPWIYISSVIETKAIITAYLPAAISPGLDSHGYDSSLICLLYGPTSAWASLSRTLTKNQMQIFARYLSAISPSLWKTLYIKFIT